ncbi:extensin [Streptomyces sp. NPDC046985]|uniref:extensin n=1 Tax=Streptomyces sp. NPDC046985 TaxID=3155377 RepID=UPI0033DE56D9
MADEQYHWLDRDTAERLLRGEPLDAVEAAGAAPGERAVSREHALPDERAVRLAETLNDLSAAVRAVPPSAPAGETGAELPGEAAALAAFRAARAERAAAGAPGRAAAVPADAGVVRIGVPGGGSLSPRDRAGWGRPVRLALSAALAACAVGGVAVAATGVLPTPFGSGAPAPAGSVPDRPTPVAPAVSASPDGPLTRRPGPSAPAGVLGGSPGAAASAPGGGAGPGSAGRDGGTADDSARIASRLAAACRALRDGTDLDAGREHALAGAAGGAAHMKSYCAALLKAADDRRARHGGGHGDGGGRGDGRHREGHGGGRHGQGGDGRGKNGGGGGGGGRAGDDPHENVVLPRKGVLPHAPLGVLPPLGSSRPGTAPPGLSKGRG